MVYVVCMIVIHYDWPDIDPPPSGVHTTTQDETDQSDFFLVHLKKNHPNQEYSTAVYPSIPFSEKSTSDFVREGPELGLDVS